MNNATPADTNKRDATLAVGFLTILWSVGYAALGGKMAWSGYEILNAKCQGQHIGEMERYFKSMAFHMISVGLVWVLQGLFGILAARGVFLGKQWGRRMTFLVAGLAAFWCICRLDGKDVDPQAIAFTAIELLFALFVIGILMVKRKEFS
jgi:hypothetical protein